MTRRKKRHRRDREWKGPKYRWFQHKDGLPIWYARFSTHEWAILCIQEVVTTEGKTACGSWYLVKLKRGRVEKGYGGGDLMDGIRHLEWVFDCFGSRGHGV